MNMSTAPVGNKNGTADPRLAYERPDLVEAGNIAEVTQSIGDNMGSDFSYS
jgi:hypothetical protein